MYDEQLHFSSMTICCWCASSWKCLTSASLTNIFFFSNAWHNDTQTHAVVTVNGIENSIQCCRKKTTQGFVTIHSLWPLEEGRKIQQQQQIDKKKKRKSLDMKTVMECLSTSQRINWENLLHSRWLLFSDCLSSSFSSSLTSCFIFEFFLFLLDRKFCCCEHIYIVWPE